MVKHPKRCGFVSLRFVSFRFSSVPDSVPCLVTESHVQKEFFKHFFARKVYKKV